MNLENYLRYLKKDENEEEDEKESEDTSIENILQIKKFKKVIKMLNIIYYLNYRISGIRVTPKIQRPHFWKNQFQELERPQNKLAYFLYFIPVKKI